LIIWLIPLVGAVMCEIFLWSDRKPPSARDARFTRDGGDNPPGIG
jgi:hypothetical protein